MDQEFDMIYNSNLEHNNILYTHGYSWENDVWNEDVVCKVINTLSAKSIDKNIVTKHYSRFLRDIKYSVSSDGYLFGKSFFFPRPKGHLRLVECGINDETHIKKVEIDIITAAKSLKKSTVYAFGRRKNICPRRDCYGHLLGDFCNKLVQFLLKKYYALTGLNTEFIKRIAINNFYKLINVDIRNHYTTIIN